MTDDEIIAVVQAHREGKQIQWRIRSDKWEAKYEDLIHSTFGWDFTTYEYRVKPEPRKPREWDVLISVDGKILESPRPSFDQEKQFYCKTIRVREVIE